MFPLSIPLTYTFLLLCFSFLLRSTHSHIQRHEIHRQDEKDEVRTRIQYYINTKSCHLIFFFLSSQLNQISFSLLNMSFSHTKKKQRDDLLSYPLTQSRQEIQDVEATEREKGCNDNSLLVIGSFLFLRHPHQHNNMRFLIK